MNPLQPQIHIADTDLLSAFIKIDHVNTLITLFNVETIYITPSVLDELNRTPTTFIPRAVKDLLELKILTVVSLSDIEIKFSVNLPNTLASGERQTMAYAKFHGGIVLSNESRVAHWCAQIGVSCVRLPAILRGLWQSQLVTNDDVKHMIHLLEIRDRMVFSPLVLKAIFDTQE